MKIGINARFLGKPYTGIGQYTLNIIRELSDADPNNEYILVVSEEIGRENKFPANVRTHVIHEIKRGTAGMKKTWWEQISVPSFFEKEKVDIAFFPYPSNPWFGTFYNHKKKIKTVVTVHDTVPWENKNYRKGVLSKLYHFQSKKAVKKADIVLTVSNYSKSRIEKVCHILPAKIKVIYNAANEIFTGPAEEKITNAIMEKFGLRKNKFFLYCGGYDERKNVRKLIEEYLSFADKTSNQELSKTAQCEAASHLRLSCTGQVQRQENGADNEAVHGFRQFFEPPALVLAGDRLFTNKLYIEIDEVVNGKEEKIIRTGFLSDEKLKSLYQNCLAYINLSKEEGFNIPIIEAAYCHAPLILSDIEVHKEVAKNHAIFVDISKKDEAKKAMEKILEKETRENYSKKSHELAGEYSWKKSAQKLKEVLFS